MSEQPLGQTVVQTDPESANVRLARHLLVEEKFHPSVVVARLERNGCDRETAQTIVDSLSGENPKIAGYRKGSEIVSVLFWILIGGAIALVVCVIFILILLFSGPMH